MAKVVRIHNKYFTIKLGDGSTIKEPFPPRVWCRYRYSAAFVAMLNRGRRR